MLSNLLKTVLKPLDDKRVSVPLSILLVLYSGLIAPEPPALLEDLMKSPAGRLVALALLALIMAKGNLGLAGLSTVAVVLSLALANRPQVIYKVVDEAKELAEQVIDVAEDAVDAVEGAVGMDLIPGVPRPDAPEGNQLENIEGVVN